MNKRINKRFGKQFLIVFLTEQNISLQEYFKNCLEFTPAKEVN